MNIYTITTPSPVEMPYGYRPTSLSGCVCVYIDARIYAELMLSVLSALTFLLSPVRLCPDLKQELQVQSWPKHTHTHTRREIQ